MKNKASTSSSRKKLMLKFGCSSKSALNHSAGSVCERQRECHSLVTNNSLILFLYFFLHYYGLKSTFLSYPESLRHLK